MTLHGTANLKPSGRSSYQYTALATAAQQQRTEAEHDFSVQIKRILGQ
jgi:hypothetical protein